jgi:REP element-mobilizing transposase RayT
MTRPLRIVVVDGWYHVFGRGTERRAIFSDERDREHWLELLAELNERYRLVIHSYALMDNHHHAILQTPEANLSRGLQWLHGSYSAWYNARHDRVGPLFQGRFQAVPVENSAWAYALSLYIHLNPLRVAGLGLDKRGRVLEGKGWRPPTAPQVTARLQQLRQERWSSYRAYAGYARPPAWLETATLLARAHREPRRRQAAYRLAARDLLRHGGEASRLERLRDGVAIGSAAFAERVRQLAAGQDWRGIAGQRAWRQRLTLGQVRQAVEELKGEPWTQFATRYGDWGCALFLWGAQRLCGVTLRELGRAAGGIAPSSVCKAIQRLNRRAAQHAALRAAQQRLLTMSIAKP